MGLLRGSGAPPNPSAFPLPAHRTGRGGLRRDLLVSTADAVAFSVMVGCGETYLPAFALAVGSGPVVAGLVASVPLLAGAIVQLAAPLAVARLGSERRWVIVCSAAQALAYVPLVIWALRGRAEAWQLLVAAAVYWSAGMAAGPAWTSWMAALIPGRIRAGYFAGRNRGCQLAVFAAFVAGGLILRAEDTRDEPLIGFAVLFTTAAVARLVSVGCLWACSEPRRRERPAVAWRPIGARLAAALRDLRHGPGGRLVAFLCSFMFGVQFAGPYFTPYMLEALDFSYGEFLVVMAAGFLVKAILLPTIGRLGSRVGPARLLRLASLAIAPLSLLWLPSSAVGWLVGVQLVAGSCWAAYELSVALLFFDLAEDRDRANVVTVYNLGLAVATVAGAACGGAVLEWLGEGREAYAAVFAGSCLIRTAALVLVPTPGRRGQPAG